MAWWLGSYQFQSRWIIDTTKDLSHNLKLAAPPPFKLFLFFLCFWSPDIPIMYHICLLSPPIYRRLNCYAVLASFPCILKFSTRCHKTLYIFLIPLTICAVVPPSFYFYKDYNNWMNANFEHINIISEPRG
jgi:hypothetical protein